MQVFKRSILGATLLAVLTACGANSERTEQTSSVKADPTEGVLFSPGEFAMYKKPFYEPTGDCDVVTRVELVNGFAGPMTALNEEVTGVCEIMVDPNGRAYDLKVERLDCGSKRYRGVRQSQRDEHMPVTIEITDNRERVCEDRMAPLVVKETYANGNVVMRYAPVAE